jgi:5-bromo-4-chloroindolyl phosphate hydrolysis protein
MNAIILITGLGLLKAILWLILYTVIGFFIFVSLVVILITMNQPDADMQFLSDQRCDDETWQNNTKDINSSEV